MFCKSYGRPLFDSGEERFSCPYCGAEVVASESAVNGGLEAVPAKPDGAWTRAGLKERALSLLSPGYWPLVLVSLVAIVIGDYGGEFLQPLFRFRINTSGTLMVQLIAFATFAWIFLFNPIAVGVRKYFVGRHRGTARLKDMFFAFGSGHYWNVVFVVLMHDLVVLLWSLLLIVPGYVKAYGLRMLVYELADNPAISWREAFAVSERVMRGQRWDAFLLDLSFILWWMLAGITCGVLGVFFVVPYFGLTLAGLYETLLGGKCAARRGDEPGQAANASEPQPDAGGEKGLGWPWMAVLALALLRPCSTIYHWLAWNTPIQSVFSGWDNFVINIPFPCRDPSWVIQYVCPLPVWALFVAGAWWYVWRRLYRRKVLTSLLIGIVLLMNVFMIRIEVQHIEAGGPEDIASGDVLDYDEEDFDLVVTQFFGIPLGVKVDVNVWAKMYGIEHVEGAHCSRTFSSADSVAFGIPGPWEVTEQINTTNRCVEVVSAVHAPIGYDAVSNLFATVEQRFWSAFDVNCQLADDGSPCTGKWSDGIQTIEIVSDAQSLRLSIRQER